MKGTFLYAVVIVTSSVFSVYTQEHEHHGADSFSEVLNFFQEGRDTLSASHTTSLIRHVLYRSSCLSRGVNCLNCLETGSVLRYLNRTSQNSLNEEAFHRLSVILVVFMMNLPGECAKSNFTIVQRQRTFDQFVVLLASDPHGPSVLSRHVHIDIHLLEEILHDIEENHRLGDLIFDSGGILLEDHSRVNYMTDVKCISPTSLFEDLETDVSMELHEEGLEELAALIVSRILQGYCVSPQDLPSSISFLANIFSSYGDGSTGKISHQSFERMLTKLGVGQSENHEEMADESSHAHSRKKRSIIGRHVLENRVTARRGKRATNHGHEPGFSVAHNCYSAEQLLDVYTENRSVSLTVELFGAVCPAIVQQILFGTCVEHADTEEKASRAEAYGYGTLAVFIITLCTLLGVVFVKIPNKDIRRRVIVFFLSLAIGTLLGDAVLHLIPEATGIHAHGSSGGDGHDHGAATIVIEAYVWKMTAILASFYAFFLLELFMNKNSDGHGHSHDLNNGHNYQLELPEEHYRKGNGVIDGHLENGVKNEQVSYQTRSGKDEALVSSDKPRVRNKALVIMVTLGDAFHNFADGMAIGAAFSLSVTGGISTSIAILCHEIPHELGDFAALISSGLSIKKALIMNFISGCTAFLGLYIGVAVAHNEEGRAWVFVLAAGMFLYVALADLVPEVMKTFKTATDSGIVFICINVGILLGFLLMFLIAVFEKHIKI